MAKTLGQEITGLLISAGLHNRIDVDDTEGFYIFGAWTPEQDQEVEMLVGHSEKSHAHPTFLTATNTLSKDYNIREGFTSGGNHAALYITRKTD